MRHQDSQEALSVTHKRIQKEETMIKLTKPMKVLSQALASPENRMEEIATGGILGLTLGDRQLLGLLVHFLLKH